jgi:hypothetical protein
MKRSARLLAALLLMLLLPVQGLAAACAQLCVKAQAAQLMAQSAGDAGEAHDCHGSGKHDRNLPPADGKCCHGHTFMMQPAVAETDGASPAIPPLAFVARWTSFIPEEPSPPPIASAA